MEGPTAAEVAAAIGGWKAWSISSTGAPGFRYFVPIAERAALVAALELAGAYEKAGAPVQLVIVHGAGHGGAAFYDEERLAVVRKFLKQY